MTHFFKNNFSQLFSLLRFMLPTKGLERIVFLASFFIYILYSWNIVFETSLIDNHYIPTDLYFSFDNTSYYHNGCGYEAAHPLIKYIMLPLVKFGNLLLLFLHYKARTLFFAISQNILVSLSVVYIFRYLRQLLELPRSASLLITAFFGFTATSLILSFTPESFTYSLFVLILMVVFCSKYIMEGERLKLLTNLSFIVLLGGITITNVAKGCIPVLFQNSSFKYKLKTGFIGITLLVTFLFCLVPGFWDTIIFMLTNFSMHSENSAQIANGEVSSLRSIIDLFFGASILFPSLSVVDGEAPPYGRIDMISLNLYDSVWQYLFIAVVFSGVIWGMVANYKNKLVQMVCLIFGVDLFIHIVCLYGLQDPFIYGGHWVFIVPIFLGWCYKSLSSVKMKKLSVAVLSILLIVLIVNNTLVMIDFTELGIKYYPRYSNELVNREGLFFF